jgi:hypothetical protein
MVKHHSLEFKYRGGELDKRVRHRNAEEREKHVRDKQPDVRNHHHHKHTHVAMALNSDSFEREL